MVNCALRTAQCEANERDAKTDLPRLLVGGRDRVPSPSIASSCKRPLPAGTTDR